MFLPLGLDIEQPAASCVPLLGDKTGIEAIWQVKAGDDPFENLGYIQELIVCVDSIEDVMLSRGGKGEQERGRKAGLFHGVRRQAHGYCGLRAE